LGVVAVIRAYRWIAIGTPVAAMATVGVGLELGARRSACAALVYGAPRANGASALAWQIAVASEDHGLREPAVGADVDVVGRAAGRSATWRGKTNADGVVEASLELPAGAPVTLEVRSAGALLAQGEATPQPSTPTAGPATAWAPFARREGAIVIDVAVLGERVAPSFPATLWVRAQDAATHAPVAGADVAPQSDASLSSFTVHARTDSRGWAEIIVTPAGLAVSLAVDAHGTDGRAGTWIGGLVASPGAAELATRPRWSPDEAVEIAVLAPPTRSMAYVEIDDAKGRAWATSIGLTLGPTLGAAGDANGPKLAPGLYWAVASDDPIAASALGAGTSARPFFVAKTDEEALALGPNPDACARPLDVRETSRAVDTCLALAVATPIGRWVALDGFAATRRRDAERRKRGLAVALAGVAIAVLLEGVLLLRAARSARTADDLVPVRGRAWTLTVAMLMGLLGFALLAEFLIHLS
jgi:hypothetical protein